jgi:hypothetical protein
MITDFWVSQYFPKVTFITSHTIKVINVMINVKMAFRAIKLAFLLSCCPPKVPVAEEKKRSKLKVDFWGQPTAISSLTRRKSVG